MKFYSTKMGINGFRFDSLAVDNVGNPIEGYNQIIVTKPADISALTKLAKNPLSKVYDKSKFISDYKDQITTILNKIDALEKPMTATKKPAKKKAKPKAKKK